jgi:hypothetical protein
VSDLDQILSRLARRAVCVLCGGCGLGCAFLGSSPPLSCPSVCDSHVFLKASPEFASLQYPMTMSRPSAMTRWAVTPCALASTPGQVPTVPQPSPTRRSCVSRHHRPRGPHRQRPGHALHGGGQQAGGRARCTKRTPYGSRLLQGLVDLRPAPCKQCWRVHACTITRPCLSCNIDHERVRDQHDQRNAVRPCGSTLSDPSGAYEAACSATAASGTGLPSSSMSSVCSQNKRGAMT